MTRCYVCLEKHDYQTHYALKEQNLYEKLTIIMTDNAFHLSQKHELQ
jgi:hypothetical protein